MVSKGDLGVSYLIAVGIGMFGALVSGLLLPLESADAGIMPSSVLGLCSGLILSGGFVLTGFRLANSELAGERVWRVATFTTYGLGIPTALIIYLLVFHQRMLEGLGWRSIAMMTIAGGGIVGVLSGTVTELRAEHDRTMTLNQRNTVFLRLFRHDIRTSVNIIQGYLDPLIGEDPSATQSVEAINDQLDHILRLSETARQLDELDSMNTTKPMDLETIIQDRLDNIRKTYSDVEIETDIPSETYVCANDLLRSVIDNLLRNAIKHNDGDRWVQVTVTPTERSRQFVQLRVRDNGPGFSENELTVHSQAIETDLHHSDGVGLWLARWIIDSYSGEFSIENAPEGGAIVTVNLPAAAPNPNSDLL